MYMYTHVRASLAVTCNTVKARNNALGGNVSKHPKTGRYFGPGRYLGPMDEFFSPVLAQYVLHQKNTCTCMHTIQDVRSSGA